MFTKEEYILALQSSEVLKDGSKDLLQAHYLHPDHIATSTQLSEDLGLNGTGPVNARFGKLGKRVAQYLKKTPPLVLMGHFNGGASWQQEKMSTTASLGSYGRRSSKPCWS